MKKKTVILSVILLALLFTACHSTQKPKENTGTISVESRNVEQLSEAVDIILNNCTADFVGNNPVTEDFFFWIAQNYGDNTIFDIVKDGNVSDSELWFRKTNKSIHVLWYEYCKTLGLDSYEYSHIHEIQTDQSYISFDFSGDVNLCEGAATTIHMDEQSGGITDCFSDELVSEMQNVDVLVLNNEFCYSNRGTPIPGKAFTFRALPQRVSALNDLGCDLVTLANNHVWDYGLDGLTDTFLTLDEASIPYVGAGNNLDEACRAQYYIANGRKIAIVDATQIERSYTYTKQATKDAPGVLKTLDPNLYCKVISDTKRQADFVIVCVHWGTEGNQHYGQDQILLANAYAESGADVIIGGHTHCLQGMEFIGDVPVFYSLGNYWFATSSNMPSNYDTGLARIEIYRNLSVTYKFIPCVFSGGETVLASEENTGRIIAELNNLSQTVTLSNEGILKKKGE